MWNFLRKLFGYIYLLNTHTGEVHKVSEIRPICGVSKMSDNHKAYITKAKFKRILKTRLPNKAYINGCKFCNHSTDFE